ncbi:MAG TPA: DinB family protein [Thermoanaerobaculia bacterium]|nr:DinB family protein [Thermoanaerobaculia bacterium]
MNTADVRILVAYNRWATERMLADVHQLDAAELTRDLHTSFGSILGTVAHIFWAEWLWVRRWQGQSPKERLSMDAYPSLADIERPWREVLADQERFVREVTDEQLLQRIAYENALDERWEYPLALMIQHLVNHSSYHRGQIVTLLRQLGRTPRSTDMLEFIDEG